MPRLLLVDDNPSIHKIAETLLATSPIELVCVESAAAALDRINRGEHFDVALVDTSMAGMDGWGLLAKLREIPATARMPIAMMAGVLDTVDPERIKEAPIQGFLKKPVELRDLGERVAKLMEATVPIPEPPPLPDPVPPPVLAPLPPPVPIPAPAVFSPFATMPAVRLEDLPEFRKKEEAAPEPQDDLLELTEEDLYSEPVPEVLVETPVEENLDLEELDLDSLRGLSAIPEESVAPTPAPMAGFSTFDEFSEPTPQSSAFPDAELDAIATQDRLPEAVVPMVEEPVTELEIMEMDLPDLGSAHEDLLDASTLSDLPEIEEMVTSEQVPVTDIPLATLLEEPQEEAVFTPPLPPLEESLDWSDDSESMLAVVESPAPQMEVTESAIPLPEEELDLLGVSVPDAFSEPDIEAPTLQLDLEEAVPIPVIEPEEEVAIEFPQWEAPSVPVPTETVVEAAPVPVIESEEEGAIEFPPVEEPPVPVLSEAIVEAALRESAAAPPEEPEAEPAPVAPVSGLISKELLDVMMSDPVLMDALAKAVVARLGDQILREIAWEVIPGLADRFPRN